MNFLLLVVEGFKAVFAVARQPKNIAVSVAVAFGLFGWSFMLSLYNLRGEDMQRQEDKHHKELQQKDSTHFADRNRLIQRLQELQETLINCRLEKERQSRKK